MNSDIIKKTLEISKNIAIFIWFSAITTNAIIDLFDKWSAYHTKFYTKSYVPEWTNNIHINKTTMPQSIITISISDIIKKKWWYDSIPDIISHNNAVNTIDIRDYKSTLEQASLSSLSTWWNSETSYAINLVHYLQKDFQWNQCILEDVSSLRVGIVADDSYRDKVAKIHKFVRWLWYERDLLYLGKDWNLLALSDYQLPSVANLIIGKMDCNNKAGLFVQLCWVNNIVVGLGSSMTHMSPVVYSDVHDNMRNFIKPNTSVWSMYNGAIVDPTNTDISNKIARPGIVWDMIWDKYNGMKFVVANIH